MRLFVQRVYRIFQVVFLILYTKFSHAITCFYFEMNKVDYGKFRSIGIPLVDVHPKGKCAIGSDLVLVNNAKFSALGKNNKCKIVVSSGAQLLIGNKVGMSNAVIVATSSIKIGNNILIGGGTTIVDTDFHSLNPSHWHTDADLKNMQMFPVVINDNVFIGMNSIILKGVTIGSNSIIAAGSVISKDIPENQIWGGNPARFIKNKETFNNQY